MCDLTKPQFQDADKAREYLEELRWGGNPVCPHCKSEGAYAISGGRKGLYKCKSCRKQFTVTVGTVFENSRVPLNKWLMSVYMMASSKKGVSTKQIERMLGVTYKTAWFMTHRIREAMKPESGGMFGSGGGVVEVDETFIGKQKGIPAKHAGYQHKNKILSLVDRETKNAKSIVIKDVKLNTILPLLQENISPDAYVMTDDAGHYRNLKKHFKHDSVQHFDREYVCRLDPSIHTNTVEAFFSIFKRGMKGIYQHCSSDHLQRYITEFDFRYNHREKNGYDDAMRADAILKGIEGKRLTYQSPVR